MIRSGSHNEPLLLHLNYESIPMLRIAEEGQVAEKPRAVWRQLQIKRLTGIIYNLIKIHKIDLINELKASSALK